MIKINMQYFGGNGASSGKSGGAAGGAAAQASAKDKAQAALSELTSSSSLQDRKNAINLALEAGVKDGVVEAAKQFPKGTVMHIRDNSIGYSATFYIKTGNAGKDGWRNGETFEKGFETSSILLYKNGGAKEITNVHKG